MPSPEIIVIEDSDEGTDDESKTSVENTLGTNWNSSKQTTEDTSENTERCPGWLIDSLDTLAKEYPNDRFEVETVIVDKITEVPFNDLLPSGQSFFGMLIEMRKDHR